MLGIPKGSPLKGKIALIVFFSASGGVALFCLAESGYKILMTGVIISETIVTAFFVSPLLLFLMWLTWSHGLKYNWLCYQVAGYAKKKEYVKAVSLVEKKLSSPKKVQRITALSLKPPYIIQVNWATVERDWSYHLKMLLEVEKKNYHKALEYVDEVIKLEPINPKLWWYNKACLHCLLEDPSSALESLNSLKKIIVSNPRLSKKILRIAKKDKNLKVLHDTEGFKEILLGVGIK